MSTDAGMWGEGWGWLPLGLACWVAGDSWGAPGVEEPRPAQRLLQERRVLVIGHRGFCAAAPENTLPSFQLALAAGADLVELDYHPARDGTPIVIHDRELDRTTDARERWQAERIRVETRTAAELQQLDAGKWFGASFAGTRLPLLAEAVDYIQSRGGVTLIERKGGDAEACARFLAGRDWLNRVIVQSFDWSFLGAVHRLEPRQVLGALGPPGSVKGRKLEDAEKVLDARWVDQALATGARAVVWNQQITRDAVAYAHGKDAKVWVYTIDDPPLANQLLDLGIDGLISNNPALVWRVLALRAASHSR